MFGRNYCMCYGLGARIRTNEDKTLIKMEKIAEEQNLILLPDEEIKIGDKCLCSSRGINNSECITLITVDSIDRDNSEEENEETIIRGYSNKKYTYHSFYLNYCIKVRPRASFK